MSDTAQPHEAQHPNEDKSQAARCVFRKSLHCQAKTLRVGASRLTICDTKSIVSKIFHKLVTESAHPAKCNKACPAGKRRKGRSVYGAVLPVTRLT